LKGRQALLALVAIVALAMFAQSVRQLGLEQMIEGLDRVGWGFVAIVLLSGAREAVRTLAWMRTTEGPVPLRFPQAFRARLVGEALNTLLPMGLVVGEPTKASHAGSDIPFATAFNALVVEFAFYCLSLVLLFCAGFSAFLLLSDIRPSVSALSLGITTVAMAAVGAFHVRRSWRATAHGQFIAHRHGRIATITSGAVGGLRRLRDLVIGFTARHPEQVGAIVALEIAYQIFAVTEVYFTLLLVSPSRPTFESAIVLETVSRAVTMVFKVVPLRVGVDEVSSSLFAGRVQLSGPIGLTLAIVRKLRLLFWGAIGLALLARRPAWANPVVARS
jgi:hypothetical protein